MPDGRESGKQDLHLHWRNDTELNLTLSLSLHALVS